MFRYLGIRRTARGYCSRMTLRLSFLFYPLVYLPFFLFSVLPQVLLLLLLFSSWSLIFTSLHFPPKGNPASSTHIDLSNHRTTRRHLASHRTTHPSHQPSHLPLPFMLPYAFSHHRVLKSVHDLYVTFIHRHFRFLTLSLASLIVSQKFIFNHHPPNPSILLLSGIRCFFCLFVEQKSLHFSSFLSSYIPGPTLSYHCPIYSTLARPDINSDLQSATLTVITI